MSVVQVVETVEIYIEAVVSLFALLTLLCSVVLRCAVLCCSAVSE